MSGKAGKAGVDANDGLSPTVIVTGRRILMFVSRTSSLVSTSRIVPREPPGDASLAWSKLWLPQIVDAPSR